MNQATLFATESATAHADAVHAGWAEQAGMLLALYVSQHQGEFMSEDYQAFAFNHGLPQPPDGRAFGTVMVKAQRDGLIEKIGIRAVRKRCAHSRPGNVLRRA